MCFSKYATLSFRYEIAWTVEPGGREKAETFSTVSIESALDVPLYAGVPISNEVAHFDNVAMQVGHEVVGSSCTSPTVRR